MSLASYYFDFVTSQITFSGVRATRSYRASKAPRSDIRQTKHFSIRDFSAVQAHQLRYQGISISLFCSVNLLGQVVWLAVCWAMDPYHCNGCFMEMAQDRLSWSWSREAYVCYSIYDGNVTLWAITSILLVVDPVNSKRKRQQYRTMSSTPSINFWYFLQAQKNTTIS